MSALPDRAQIAKRIIRIETQITQIQQRLAYHQGQAEALFHYAGEIDARAASIEQAIEPKPEGRPCPVVPLHIVKE